MDELSNQNWKPICWSGKCKNAWCMQESVELWLAFWVRLRASEAVPKELMLKIAECDDAASLEILSVLDTEFARIQEAKREKQRNSG